MNLSTIDITKLKLKDGRTFGSALLAEGNRLKELLYLHLKSDALIIEPVMYQRTFMIEKSFIVDSRLQYRNGKICAVVLFDDSWSGASGYGVWSNKLGDLGEYNLADLLDKGYQVNKDVWFKHLENFGYRKPSYFIRNAIEDFNAQNSLGIFIDYNTDVILI